MSPCPRPPCPPVGRQNHPVVAQAFGEEPGFPLHWKASPLVAPPGSSAELPPPPAGSVLFCSASLFQKTLPAQPQNGLLSSSYPPALDLPAREAAQPTLAGSCLTALSCGLPGCRFLPPACCCLHPARSADSQEAPLALLSGAGGSLQLLQL